MQFMLWEGDNLPGKWRGLVS